MSTLRIPVEKLITGCPTCSYQNGGNPGAEFFLYMMLAIPWIIMAVVGFYFWTRRQKGSGDDGTGNPPISPSGAPAGGHPAPAVSTASTPQ